MEPVTTTACPVINHRETPNLPVRWKKSVGGWTLDINDPRPNLLGIIQIHFPAGEIISQMITYQKAISKWEIQFAFCKFTQGVDPSCHIKATTKLESIQHLFHPFILLSSILVGPIFRFLFMPNKWVLKSHVSSHMIQIGPENGSVKWPPWMNPTYAELNAGLTQSRHT